MNDEDIYESMDGHINTIIHIVQVRKLAHHHLQIKPIHSISHGSYHPHHKMPHIHTTLSGSILCIETIVTPTSPLCRANPMQGKSNRIISDPQSSAAEARRETDSPSD